MAGFFLENTSGLDFITIDAPSGPNIVNAQGLNNKGLTVRFYVGTDGQDHGFMGRQRPHWAACLRGPQLPTQRFRRMQAKQAQRSSSPRSSESTARASRSVTLATLHQPTGLADSKTADPTETSGDGRSNLCSCHHQVEPPRRKRPGHSRARR
jgi:hypothetical protein